MGAIDLPKDPAERYKILKEHATDNVESIEKNYLKTISTYLHPERMIISPVQVLAMMPKDEDHLSSTDPDDYELLNPGIFLEDSSLPESFNNEMNNGGGLQYLVKVNKSDSIRTLFKKEDLHLKGLYSLETEELLGPITPGTEYPHLGYSPGGKASSRIVMDLNPKMDLASLLTTGTLLDAFKILGNQNEDPFSYWFPMDEDEKYDRAVIEFPIKGVGFMSEEEWKGLLVQMGVIYQMFAQPLGDYIPSVEQIRS